MIATAVHARKLQVITLLCFFVGACASDPVSLDARPVAASRAPKVATPIAYLHSKDFREDVRTVEPYGNRYYLPLKIGEASDQALRAAYDRVFIDAREVGTLTGASNLPSERPQTTIEPSVLRFDYINASGRMWGPYYAEIVYGFALYDSAGARVAQWRVSGFGEFDMNREAKERRPDFPRGETAIMSEAARRAVENGVAGFMAGFERIPELMRLGRNLPLTGSNAPSSVQVTRTAASAIEAEYPGVLALRVESGVVLAPPKDVKDLDAPKPQMLTLRLSLRNSGAHRLVLDPSNAQWLPDSTSPPASEPIAPLPAHVASALLTGRPVGMAIGVMSPGVGMLPALLAALFSAAENERHTRELAAWRAAIEGEYLGAATIAGGADRSGILCFPWPTKAEAGTLVLPIVDLDDALRYTVRVPLPAK